MNNVGALLEQRLVENYLSTSVWNFTHHSSFWKKLEKIGCCDSISAEMYTIL